METERAQLEAMRDEATEKSEESRKLLERIAEANRDIESQMEVLNKTRQDCEERRQAASAEIASAAYASDMAKHLTISFRQELARFMQMTGQEIRIPNLTDEHLRFAAKHLLAQCSSPEPSSPEPSVTEPSEIVAEPATASSSDRETLRAAYEEKFGTKPFNGWTAEQLSEKINAQ